MFAVMMVLRSKLRYAHGIRQGDGHNVGSRQHAQAPPRAGPLAEFSNAIRADVAGIDQGWNRVPAMRAEDSRRRMVAAHDDYIWVKRHQARDQLIHLLDHAHFAHKIAALAAGIGFLDMQVEKVEI